MFETMNPLSHPEDPRSGCRRGERDANSICTAVNAFNEMIRKGAVRRLLSRLFHRSNKLLDLGAIKLKIRNSVYRGVQIVPIDQIHGSEGRAEDFDDRFHPLSRRMKDRWVSVGIAHYQGMALPPIQLLLIEGQYFVRDGHHRISVAKAFGQRLMDAEVTEVTLDVPAPWMQPAEAKPVAHILECKAG